MPRHLRADTKGLVSASPTTGSADRSAQSLPSATSATFQKPSAQSQQWQKILCPIDRRRLGKLTRLPYQSGRSRQLRQTWPLLDHLASHRKSSLHLNLLPRLGQVAPLHLALVFSTCHPPSSMAMILKLLDTLWTPGRCSSGLLALPYCNMLQRE